MADHAAPQELTFAAGNDYPAHLRSYEGFLTFAKYATIGIAILLILMAFFLL
jgi:hypothetical protein